MSKVKNMQRISHRRPIRRIVVLLICLAVFLVGIGSASPVRRDCPGGGGTIRAEGSTATTPVIEGQDAGIVKNEEVVYGRLNADGTPREFYVVESFNVAKEGVLSDVGNFDRLVNLTSSTEIEYRDNKLRVQVEPGLFFYQGNVSGVELPWEVFLSYTLDGQPIGAEELSGRNGDLLIKLAIRPRASISDSMRDYYILQTQLTFDSEAAEVIDAPLATQALAGNNRVVSFTTLPGKEDNYELRLAITDFHMDPISITALSMEFPFDLKADDFTKALDPMLDGLRDLNDGLQKLNDGMPELKTGTTDLTDGADALTDGGKELLKGADELLSGLKKYVDGVGAVLQGIERLADGSAQLVPAGEKLANGLGELRAGGPALADGLRELAQGLGEMARQIRAQLAELPQVDAAGIEQLLAGSQAIRNALAELKQSGTALAGGAEQGLAGLAQLGEKQAELAQLAQLLQENPAALAQQWQLSPEALQNQDVQILFGVLQGILSDINQGLSGLGQLSELLSGIPAYTSGVSALADQYAQLDAALAQLVAEIGRMAQLAGGMNELADNLDLFKTGLDRALAGLEQYFKGVDAVYAGLAGVRDKNGKLTTPGLNSGLAQLNQGLRQLYDGSSAIGRSGSQLTGGQSEIVDGISKLIDGNGELADGLREYASGINKVADGVGEMADGTAEIDERLDNIDKEIMEQIEEKFPVLKKGTLELTSFVPGRDSRPDTQQFILLVDGVDKVERSTPIVDEPKAKSLWERILDVFR
ncbi:MAG: hypothetical protein GX907_02030 [Clostridiaceae bacterium]|nr:hypothetical protein [Clostridiaceae bacterium]